MAEISKIMLPSGTTYDIKDAVARAVIAGGTSFLGVTTTELTDGSSASTITISGNSVSAVNGGMVIYGNKEFIYSSNDSKWHELGDSTGLKDLAYKDSVSASYTPHGSVSQPTFTGSEMTATGTVVPSGNVSVITSATTNKTATVSEAATGDTTYTPGGTVSQPSFSGTAKNISVSGTPTGNVSIGTGNGTSNYTPEGSVTVTPNVSVNTTTVNSITDVGSLPELTTTVFDETLSISFSQGSLPTKGTDTTVATGIKSATATGSFSGTSVELTGTFSGNSMTSTGSYTPEGTVSQPSFTGTGARLVTGNIPVPNTYTATFTGTEATISVSGTPDGTVSIPTFTGTSETITSN